MADSGLGSNRLVVVVVVLIAAVAVLAYMWWQEEESNEFEIEIGSAGTEAAAERGGTPDAAAPVGLAFRRS